MMKLRFILLLAVVFGCIDYALSQELVDYGVYRIDQGYDGDGYRGKSITANGIGNLTLANSNSSDEKQLWVSVPDENHTGHYLRNYVTGFYMASPIAINQTWYVTTPENLDPTRSVFNVSAKQGTDDCYLIYPSSIIGTANEGTQNGYAHATQQGTVICYGMGAAASGWKLTSIDKSLEEVTDRMERWGLSPVEPGAIYTIVNKSNGQALTLDPLSGTVKTEPIGNSDLEQLWVIERDPSGSAFFVRNYKTGYCLTSPLSLSAPWTADYTVMPISKSQAMKIEFSGDSADAAVISPLELDKTSYNAQIRENGFAEVLADGSISSGPASNPTAQWTFIKADEITPTMMADQRAQWYTYAKGIVDGHVYRFTNVGYGQVMGANGNTVRPAALDEDNLAQLWVAVANRDGYGYYLRNLSSGHYLHSPRTKSGEWTARKPFNPNDDNVVMNFVPTGSDYFIIPVSAFGKTTDEYVYGNAHQANTGKIVGWDMNSQNSKWSVTEVAMAPEQIAAAQDSWLEYASEITPGLYYISNINYNTNLAPNNKQLCGKTPDDEDLNQVWLVEKHPDGEGYVLRNYNSGLTVVSPKAASQAWTLSDMYFPDFNVSGLYFNLKDDGIGITNVSTFGTLAENQDYNYAHIDGQNRVVGWLVTSAPSRWMFRQVKNISQEDLAAKRQTWDSFTSYNIENALAAIFTDIACSELTEEYANKSVEALDSDPNVLILPEPLQNMVRKAVSGDWSEIDPTTGMEWDSEHAKKFRVMMAEPYSDSGASSSLAGIQAYGELNNPTGIVTDSGDVLYIFLDKEPAEGSTITIAGRTGEGTPLATLNNNSDGTKLHKGLNVVQCDKDLADMILYYTVRTNNRTRDLTTYEDIKIHIEGGSLNGYFNYEGDALYTPDTNEDWLYYRERARHTMFTLLSKYNALYIHFDDIINENGSRTQCLKSLCSPEAYQQGKYDLRATMKAWDELYLAETLIMGLQPPTIIEAEKSIGRDYYDTLDGDPIARDDYYKYFNNRHLGISLRECGFMNATWWRTAYNPSVISSIIREFPTGDFWGPAHEMGHLNQGPMNMAGCSEESNNVFSNVALFYRGQHTSRADYPSVQRQRFNEGQNFHQHDTWGTTRMWFQLWLYYHAIGHNKKFYPRLYELLRRNPLRRTPAPGHEGEVNPFYAKDDQLHFAKMVCMAAEEDLTDFFDAWGFLEVQDGYFIGDYTSYTAYLSAEEIADWRNEIATMAAENGWPKNEAIIFIDDRVGSSKQSYAFDKNKCGSMGGLKDFSEGAPINGEYSFTISGTTVQVTGATGGVGFLIHDANGELIGFANEPVFQVSEEAAEKIRAGECTFDVVCPDNTSITVVDAVNAGSLAQRLEAMDIMLDKARVLLSKCDPEGRKLGYLKSEVMASLREAYNSAKTLRDNGEITIENNVALYNELHDQYLAHKDIVATIDNTIEMVPGGTYVFISNLQYTGSGLTPNANGNALTYVKPENVDIAAPAQQWVFEPTDEEGYYYIRNVANGKYINKANANNSPIPLGTDPMKQLLTFKEFGGYAISPLGNDEDSFHYGAGGIVRWTANATASRWTLQNVDGWDLLPYISELNAAINRTQSLLKQAGTISGVGSSLTAVASADYSLVPPELMIQIHNLLIDARDLAAAPTNSEDLENMTINLNTVYDELTLAMDSNRGRLEDLIEMTRALANELAEIEESVDPIALNASLLESNACHTGNGSDKFTSWNVLLDNNLDTYFHSTYAGNSTDGLDHYIKIELPEVPMDEKCVIFGYTTRKNNDSNWFPADATLQYSADNETWTDLTKFNQELPYASAVKFESDPINIPAGTRYLRFMVHKSRRSATSTARGTSNGHDYFVLSELGLGTYSLSSAPNTSDYPRATEDAINGAMRQAMTAQITLGRPHYRNRQFDAAYDQLMPHYLELVDIAQNKGVETGIEAIDLEGDQLENAVIYNLNGVRLQRIPESGIYIVNGRKVIVR